MEQGNFHLFALYLIHALALFWVDNNQKFRTTNVQ